MERKQLTKSWIDSNCRNYRWLLFAIEMEIFVNMSVFNQLTVCLLETPKRTLTDSEDPDEMPHDAAFHQGLHYIKRVQWLSGRVLESRVRGCRFKPHRHHCIVSLSKTN